MKVSERKAMNKKMRRAKRAGFVTGVFTVILIITMTFGIGSFYASAKNDSHDVQSKYYKSIQIQKGDSLWSISTEYMNESYDSVYDYMAELIEINQLEEHEIDHLKEGDYLTVSYFGSEE